MATYEFRIQLAANSGTENISIETDEVYNVAERFALEAVGLLVEGGWAPHLDPGFEPIVELVKYHTVAASPA